MKREKFDPDKTYTFRGMREDTGRPTAWDRIWPVLLFIAIVGFLALLTAFATADFVPKGGR